ncbi:hypothetical protein J5N97_006458 [Dioscorea zingiberensis]|uniref:Uncharacterized protein n=1 Tax=Dioscorea zingiberensis TaxID=325984 RepID=A0A9D5DD49_9LILI|nr:hypothetical protein J5N97_006458 [Dioscorea zingiberensis]
MNSTPVSGMEIAGFPGTVFPSSPRSLHQRLDASLVASERSSCGQPVRDGKGPPKLVETIADINMPMEGGEDAIVSQSYNYNVETMANTDLPMEGGEVAREDGGEDFVFTHNYNVDPMPDPEPPLEGGEHTDGSQGMDVGRENVPTEDNEEDEDLSEDSKFREFDEEVEDEEDDLFFSAADSDAYESKLRAWLGRELGRREEDMSEQDSENANNETLLSLFES